MEDGTITLVGATTENPSFELNAALLSRAIVLTLNRLDDAALEGLLAARRSRDGPHAAARRRCPRRPVAMADGDGRAILNLAEEVFAAGRAGATPLDREALVTPRPAPRAALRQGAAKATTT